MNRIIDLRRTSPADNAAAQANAGRPLSDQRHLDPHAIAFITAVKDETQYRICLQYLEALQIPPGYNVEKIAVFGGASMSECYQRAMDASTARYKIYLHVDAYVVHRGLLPDLISLFEGYPRLGLVGVVGSTRLPPSGMYWVNNPIHSYGRLWQNSTPGFPKSVLGLPNRRRLHLMRFRSLVGDYLPAAIVDGFFMATQYDIPWTRPLLGFDFGFDLYDHVQALEFIRAGLEVGIARQDAIWCVHWGPLEEPSGEQQRRRQGRLRQQAEALRQLYPGFVGVPARKLYKQHRAVRTTQGDLNSSDSTRDRLGVIIFTSSGRGVLLPTLRTLQPQCEALDGIGYRVVVVDSDCADTTAEAVAQEFPQATVIANDSDGSPAVGFNLGLRHLSFPRYVLIMSGDVKLSAGAVRRMVGYLREHPSAAGAVVSRDPMMTFANGSCALVRGEVFYDVGLFDERFPQRADRDWWLRAKRRGYKFVFLPDALVRHRGAEFQRMRRETSAEFFAADLWLTNKHCGSRWAAALYWTQRLRGRWLALQWRSNAEALCRLDEAMSHAEALYRGFREENRLPQLL